MAYSENSRYLTFLETLEWVTAAHGADSEAAIRDLARAGREGAFVATRRPPGKRKRRRVRPEDWEDANLARVAEFPEFYDHLWIPRTDIQRLWPSRPNRRASAKNQAADWIRAQKSARADWSGRKTQAFETAKSSISGLSRRSFDEVWRNHAQDDWKTPGRRKIPGA